MSTRPRTALAAALLLVLAGCGTGGTGTAEPGPTQTVAAPVTAERTHPPAPAPAAPTPAWTPPPLDLASLPVADPWAVLPRAVPDPDPGAVPSGQLVAPSTPAGAPLYDAPRGEAFALLPVAAYQGDTAYPVVAQEGDWYQVMLVVRRGLPSEVGPSGVNEATGWVWAGDVTTSTTDLRITATLSTGEVTLWRGEEVLARTGAGIGTPETPTPVTRTFVMSIYPDPNATYSRLFVTFGAHSPTLDQFSGGPAPIAIHAYPSHSGAISNGCLRIPADMLDAFAGVPLGTPVLITA
ncbi:L,D-transpeptidase [Cellulomonas cellasea]|uniref:L,D-TPase catalytic domain-containing protein n=2 Tax=Cellulomonas cellasea TaxID=43670 RepID=A0A0A0B6N7_9CELL|nr:L,D-transpeptidase [Cellulomonas cellasea]KGM01857.1 hypothetical protein Q760_17030 [Cellulomonas cellasea DSM 20118]